MLAGLDKRATPRAEDMPLHVEERARCIAGEPQGHLACLLEVPRLERIPQLPVILERLDERPGRRPPDLRGCRTALEVSEASNDSGRIVKGQRRAPTSESVVQPRALPHLDASLRGRELMDRYQNPVADRGMDAHPPPSRDHEEVEIGVRAIVPTGCGPIDPHRDEV